MVERSCSMRYKDDDWFEDFYTPVDNIDGITYLNEDLNRKDDDLQ